MDLAGLGLKDRQDWIVVPVIQTRDSVSLEHSNFRVVLEDLGGESDTVEVHRFGHWGPGWFEIILVHPDLEGKVEEWESALADYPVASDSDYSEEQTQEEDDSWQFVFQSDFLAAVRNLWEGENEIDDGSTVILDCDDLGDEIDSDEMREAVERRGSSIGVYWEHTGEGASLDVERIAETLTLQDVLTLGART